MPAMSPLSDQHIILRDGRTLGYADYGDPQGKPVFLFHGIPGSRLMQHPDASIALNGNVRFIVPDRPGMGLSDYMPGRKLLDWPADIEELSNALEIEKFSVAGISGGGPYAAACGFIIPQRLIKIGLISGVGPANAPGVLKGMLSSNRMGYSVGRWMPWILWRIVFDMYYGRVQHHPEKLAQMQDEEPETDQVIFNKPGVRQTFINNFGEAFRQGTTGVARDGWILARPWEFSLEEIPTPVFLWQGEADVVVTPAMGRYMATLFPNCQAEFLPGEGHLLYITHWERIIKTLTS